MCECDPGASVRERVNRFIILKWNAPKVRKGFLLGFNFLIFCHYTMLNYYPSLRFNSRLVLGSCSSLCGGFVCHVEVSAEK